MSSGLPMTPDVARAVVKKFAGQILDSNRIETLGMTPRQAELNHLWSWFCCCRYDARKVAWDGSEHVERIDAEAIATAGVLPGGFYIAENDFPLRFRRPVAGYNLPRVIVNRFTGLLFSESQHPKIRCVGDPVMEDYVGALADYSRLWAAMIQARTYGGATGTFCIGFKFVNGKPQIEVHDPRWVTPHFKNIETQEVRSIVKRWMWPEYVRNDESGEFEAEWYWTCRIIDEKHDVIWNKVPVDPEGREPAWGDIKPDQQIEHGFDECPVQWGQNVPVSDAEDGEPDCIGVYDMVEEFDRLISAATTGTRYNLDPTLLINSDLKLAEMRKGSDNAIKLEKGAGASYLEMAGTGQAEAFKEAMQLRGWILEVAQCVLDHSDETSQETATMSRMRYASMTSKADILREQYGQKGVLPFLEKMVRAIRKLSAPVMGASGPEKRTIKLPPREVTNQDGSKQYVARELPEKESLGVLTLQWPPYFKPSLQEAQTAATAVKSAKDAFAISDETAAQFLAPYFEVEDVQAELQRIKSEQKEHDEQAKLRAQASWGGK